MSNQVKFDGKYYNVDSQPQYELLQSSIHALMILEDLDLTGSVDFDNTDKETISELREQITNTLRPF